MSDIMIRKQFYLYRRQNLLLKRLAEQRGVSEAEIIRQALEREAAATISAVKDSQKALDEIFEFVESLRNRPEIAQHEPYQWNRAELYEEREGRWLRDKKDQ
jgi:hypothetical protein